MRFASTGQGEKDDSRIRLALSAKHEPDPRSCVMKELDIVEYDTGYSN